jgi:tetratricopeptide (TPR) repeat protein
MAERAEEAETEAPEAAPSGSDGVAAAMTAALRRRKSGGEPDPEFDAFLQDQRRLINLQTEHLHEQRELILSRLRWGRFSDRMKAVLQVMTVLVGLAVAAAVAVMAWQAHEDHGVAIEAFSVPPDLAQRGLTGQVVASEVLDRLSDLQAQTVTGRPASTYANDWGGDIKVEIPETGVSVGELNRWLRQWLGSETRITGEVVRTPAGLAVTARAGAGSGKRFEGAEADVDKLVGQAAEALYAQTQPYRYAVYLASTGRAAEAEAQYARLAQSGSEEDRAWAYAGWATMLLRAANKDPARVELAARIAQAAIRIDPRLYPAYPIRGAALHRLGRDEAALAVTRQEIAMHQSGRFIGLPKAEAARRLALVRGNSDFLWGDYRTAAALIAESGGGVYFEGQTEAYNLASTLAPSLALDHDVTASRRVQPAGTFEQAAALDDWAAQLPLIERLRSRFPPGAALPPLGAPGVADAYAHLHRFAEAEAALAGAPLDCDHCVLERGVVAALKHDWPAADRWFAQAAGQAPSLPFAHTQWGQALLDKGDLDGAIAKFREAHRRSPHFADPLELWGEALMRKGDYAGAIGRFAEADKDAPRWGRNHLRWGEALLRLGRYREERVQFEAANGMDLSRPDRAALNVFLNRTANGPLHG